MGNNQNTQSKSTAEQVFPKACGREDFPRYGEYIDPDGNHIFVLNNKTTPAGIYFSQVVRKPTTNPDNKPDEYYTQQFYDHNVVKHKSYPLKAGIFYAVKRCFEDPILLQSTDCRGLFYNIRKQHSSVDKFETKLKDQQTNNNQYVGWLPHPDT